MMPERAAITLESALLFEEPSREEWGVCRVQTVEGVRSFQYPFLQSEIDSIEQARILRETLTPNAAIRSGLARNFWTSSLIPWGQGLADRTRTIKFINQTLEIADRLIDEHQGARRHPRVDSELKTIEQIRNHLEGFRIPHQQETS